MKFNTVLPGKTYWYYANAHELVYLDTTNKTYLENANLFWKYASAKNLFWDKNEELQSLASTLGGKTTSIEQFVCWKSPLRIPNNKLLDHKKMLHEELLRN